MKVITEERLKELIYSGEFSNFNRERNLLLTLLNNTEEIDTLTVSKLRPMSDLLQRKDYKIEVLATRNSEYFMKIRQSSDDEVYCFELGKYLPASQFVGWVPNIIYKPELTGDGE